MKVVIFAGGSGRRLWPLSRKRSPKQFEPIIGEQSTLQLAVDRVLEQVGAENIFISTNTAYVPILREQLPMLPERNFIGEPMRRDLAAAVGLAMTHMVASADPDEPISIMWGDNYMEEVATFRKVLSVGEQIVGNGEAKIVYMGETPRFANDNLGWIGLGKKRGAVDETPYFEFDSLTYRPELSLCEKMYAAGTHVWNTGYFITTIGYIGEKYAQHQPDMWEQLQKIGAAIGSDEYEETLNRIYPQLEETSFDDAVLVHLDPNEARVLHAEMGWSDPGTLYALKEALAGHEDENVTRGIVKAINSRDSLLYNYESDKVLAGIGLDGMIVVNTDDALLVVHKSHIPLVKRLVNEMVDTELDKFT